MKHGVYTPAEVAEIFRVQPETVRRWANQGKIPVIRTAGKHRRFPAAAIDALAAGLTPAASPLTGYMDAVVDALMNADLGVRDHQCDENGPIIEIELDPVLAVRQPVMDWTPTAGWRVAMRLRGKIRPATVRYVGIDPVPYPNSVASTVIRWTAAPDHLLTAAPSYKAMPRAELGLRLTQAAAR